jgi:hypothetical protein
LLLVEALAHEFGPPGPPRRWATGVPSSLRAVLLARLRRVRCHRLLCSAAGVMGVVVGSLAWLAEREPFTSSRTRECNQ